MLKMKERYYCLECGTEINIIANVFKGFISIGAINLQHGVCPLCSSKTLRRVPDNETIKQYAKRVGATIESMLVKSKVNTLKIF
jgi:DNA-directed RNA polymerase subunit RPC12/RpoP